MRSPSRREFLHTGAALAAVPVFGRAADPVVRPGPKSDVKLSLAAYSYRQALDLKKPTMTLFDVMDTAADLGVQGVELTSYYYPETTDAYIDKLKAHAAKKNLAVSCLPVGNDFCITDAAKWKAQIQHVKDWTERAARLGSPNVRIFAGKVEKGDTLENAQKRCIEAIQECCEHAAKFNVVLALENHGGITATPDMLLTLVKPVKSKHLAVNLDSGNFRTDDPYADLAKIVPYAVVAQIKVEVFPMGKPKQEADLARVVKILKDGNFHGYAALEYEAADDPKVAIPKFVKELKKLLSE
jgi:sugar phosphate isomerase/epimerase